MEDKKKVENTTSQPLPEIRRGALSRLTIYEVEESELETLEKGSPDSLYLTFSVFLLTTAISFFIALVTTQVAQKIYTIFVVITVVGFIIGIFLLIIWCKKRKSIPDLICKIKKRLPPEGIQESSNTSGGTIPDSKQEE